MTQQTEIIQIHTPGIEVGVCNQNGPHVAIQIRDNWIYHPIGDEKEFIVEILRKTSIVFPPGKLNTSYAPVKKVVRRFPNQMVTRYYFNTEYVSFDGERQFRNFTVIITQKF